MLPPFAAAAAFFSDAATSAGTAAATVVVVKRQRAEARLAQDATNEATFHTRYTLLGSWNWK